MTMPAEGTDPDEFRTFLDDDSDLDEGIPDPFATPPPDPRLNK